MPAHWHDLICSHVGGLVIAAQRFSSQRRGSASSNPTPEGWTAVTLNRTRHAWHEPKCGSVPCALCVVPCLFICYHCFGVWSVCPFGTAGTNELIYLNPRNIRIPRYYRLSVSTGVNCHHDTHTSTTSTGTRTCAKDRAVL